MDNFYSVKNAKGCAGFNVDNGIQISIMSARYARAVFEQHDDIDLFGSDAAKGFRSEHPNSPSCTHLARCISPRQEGVKPVNVSFDFINQVLLDKRLSVASFKLWYFLKERSNSEGKSFHGHRSISAITGIRKKSLKRYISELVEAGYLKVEHRPNTSDLYTIVGGGKTPPGWGQNAPRVGAKRPLSTLNSFSTLNLVQTPIPPLNTKTQPLLIPESQALCDMSLKIYEAYPRKVGKPAALRAIRKAMQKFDPEWLLEKTKAYAEVRDDAEEQYTPHPATWFNQERFNDSPQDWNPNHKPKKRTLTPEQQVERMIRMHQKIQKWCDEAPEAIHHENH